MIVEPLGRTHVQTTARYARLAGIPSRMPRRGSPLASAGISLRPFSSPLTTRGTDPLSAVSILAESLGYGLILRTDKLAVCLE